jgi:nucleotide-binding universal stress UspA family protein
VNGVTRAVVPAVAGASAVPFARPLGTPLTNGGEEMGRTMETIVVGYDGSQMAQRALDEAVNEAKRRGSCRILMACGHQQPLAALGFAALRTVDAQSRRYWDELADRIAAELEAEATRVRAAGIECSTTCATGQPAEILLDAARTSNASLIVVGAWGASERGSLGSTIISLLQQTTTPVLVVPG